MSRWKSQKVIMEFLMMERHPITGQMWSFPCWFLGHKNVQGESGMVKHRLNSCLGTVVTFMNGEATFPGSWAEIGARILNEQALCLGRQGEECGYRPYGHQCKQHNRQNGLICWPSAGISAKLPPSAGLKDDCRRPSLWLVLEGKSAVVW